MKNVVHYGVLTVLLLVIFAFLSDLRAEMSGTLSVSKPATDCHRLVELLDSREGMARLKVYMIPDESPLIPEM